MEKVKTFKGFLLTAIMLALALSAQGQKSLDEYTWKNRVLLILSSPNTSDVSKKQLELLGPLNSDFDDRKLMVLQVSDEYYRVLNGKSPNRYLKSQLYNTYNSQGQDFQIVLIGLDGRLKLQQQWPVKRNELFALIDGMPMRQAELKAKN